MMEWAEMLPEVLDIIAEKYITSYKDYQSFAGVCKSWRLAGLAASRTYHNSNGPPSRFPSLLLAEKSDDHESRELFPLSNKSIQKIQLPEAYSKACKSSSGWLLTVGKDLSTQLINPLSREIINLPNVDTFPNDMPINPLYFDFAILKVVLLMESKLVLVIWHGFHSLGFCHIGDNKWTSAEQKEAIHNMTFYNGHVYCFDCFDTIRACNVNGKDPTILVYVATIPKDVYDQDVFSGYIVGLDDGERKRLLVIIKEGVFNDGKCPETYKTKSFQVLAFDLESRNWSKVKDFGGKTLFVGFSSTFLTEDTTGVIKGNYIYYTDDEFYEYYDAEEGGWRDMGIYHLSNGTIEPHFAGESRSHITPPLWLQPM